MRICSEITGRTYDTDKVRYIPNMLQNYCFIFLGCQKSLLDIISGEEDKLYFVWDKDSTKFKEVFKRWVDRTWRG